MMLTRFDQALAVGNRPSSFQKIKLGAKADGTLHAFEFDNYGTAGIGGGGSSGRRQRRHQLRAPYIYQVPNTRVKQAAVSDQRRRPPVPSARPPVPPSSFGMESIMDELAVKMNIDPVEFRLKNDHRARRVAEHSPERITSSARKDLAGRTNIKSLAVHRA